MLTFDEISEIVAGSRGTAGLLLAVAVLALFGVELWIWLGRYARIAKYRNRRRHSPREVDGISVVVVLGNDFDYLENTVPRIMAQEFGEFELVVMEVASSPEFSDELRVLRERYPNLVSARIDPDPRFRISDKMIYNIGIKTARYANVILTTPDATPASTRWLECMAKGFGHGEVVIGYCGLTPVPGVVDKLMRCSRLMTSVRYVASAIGGYPYRGILSNLGFRKELYLESRGFNHLDITVGEDDLFVQKIATAENTSIVLNRHATMRQAVWGGLSGWWRRRRLCDLTRGFYPARARRAMGVELVARALFALAVAACAVWMPLYTALGAAGLWVVRMIVMRHQIVCISRRLGERGLGWPMVLWDVVEPIVAVVLRLSMRLRPPREMWK